MGGGSGYDRDVHSSSSIDDGWGTSDTSKKKLSSTKMHKSLDPTGKILESNAKYPIVIVLDVTGSNINFARLVYDKLPMMYGQIDQKGYLDDFEMSICAVGDEYCDSYALQISDFAKGIELDSWMEKLVLEGGGGGQQTESYELAAHYLANNLSFNKDAKPIIFFIGDEAPYGKVSEYQAQKYGIEYDDNDQGFSKLNKVVNNNVFMFLNPYCGNNFYDSINDEWTKVLPPEHLIKIKEEKSIVDLMLGVIALISKQGLDKYKVDMLDRGQTKARIANVVDSLENLSTAIVPIDEMNTTLPTAFRKPKTLGKRI